MKRNAILLLTLLLSATPLVSLAGEEESDTEANAIRAAVGGYVGGWFASDPERMREALHPNLVKYRVKKVPGGETEFLDQMGAEALIAFTGHNQEWVKGKKTREMKIVYQDPRIAVVHAVSDDFYDVCTLAKINGKWKVLTVVWDLNAAEN